MPLGVRLSEAPDLLLHCLDVMSYFVTLSLNFTFNFLLELFLFLDHFKYFNHAFLAVAVQEGLVVDQRLVVHDDALDFVLEHNHSGPDIRGFLGGHDGADARLEVLSLLHGFESLDADQLLAELVLLLLLLQLRVFVVSLNQFD